MNALQIEGLSKRYRGFSRSPRRLLAALSGGFWGFDRQYLAIDDLSLQLSRGEALGLIGRNGAGKSTLLKLIAGVLAPDRGLLQRPSDLRAILELGVGFNPELSGEENAFYNGILWGESTSAMTAAMDSIFAFAGLEEFRTQPLFSYSSGMAMRLGFALATMRRPSLLLVDEALSVGDAAFQQRCLQRMRQFQEEGSALLIVSHDLGLMSDFCDRIILLDHGRKVYDGAPRAAVEAYMHLLAKHPADSGKDIAAASNYAAFVEELSIRAVNARGGDVLAVGEEALVEISFRARVPMENLTVGFHLSNAYNQKVFGVNSRLLGETLPQLEAGDRLQVEFAWPANLAPGKYTLSASVHRGASHVEGCWFWGESLASFEIERIASPPFVGQAYLPTRFKARKL
ncbi:MAG: ABC transporter ATP-binding protein [Leptospirales bacterium]|nr:ABC transporter ATP-binding protein [Leptospirales bacterium]